MDQAAGLGKTKAEADVLIHSPKGKAAIEESSMDITETDNFYVVSFFPNAEEVEIDDKPEKGYKAIIGVLDGEHIVSKVMYSKSMYDLNKVIELAGNIRECPICKRLDESIADVGTIRLQDQYTTRTVQAAPVAPVAPVATSALFNTGNPLEDMLVRLKFDTMLNPTGKALAALALDDDALAREVMPTDAKSMVALVANLTEYAQGKGNIYRTPAEVTDYIKALREGNKSADDVKADEKKITPFVKRAQTVIIS